MTAVDVLGWAGAIALLGAQALLTTARIGARSRAYTTLNLAGSAALAVNGAAHGAWPSAGLNLLWLGVGVLGLRHPASRPAHGRPSPPGGAGAGTE